MWLRSQFNFELQRNALVPFGFLITHYDTGEAVDLTEYDIRCEIALGEGEVPIVTVGARDPDKALGKVNFDFYGSAFASLEGETERVNLAHNILARDSNGDDQIIARGVVILTPGT